MMNKKQYRRVAEILPVGKEFAMSGNRLADLIGITAKSEEVRKRDLRAVIEIERKEGENILPDNEGGYYIANVLIPKERAEAEVFWKQQEAAAMSIVQTVQAMRKGKGGNDSKGSHRENRE